MTFYNASGMEVISQTGGGGGADGGNVLAAGTRTALSNGTVLFSNANGVTFGLDTTNGTVMTASVAAGGGGGVGISAGTQSVSTGTMVFANSNGVTFGMSGSSQITASYTVPSTAGLLSAINVSAGTTSNNLSAFTMSNANGVSFGMNGSVLTASVAAAGGAQTGISGLANSETTYTSGSVSFSALGAITIRSTTGQHFQFSVNAQTVQPGIQSIAFANTTFTTGGVTFSNANGISFGSSGGQVTASYTVPTQTAFVFSNSNNVSFGTNGSTVTATATFAQTAQTQSNVQGVIVSDATYRTGDVSFSNANGISFGSSAGQAVTISHALQFTSATSAITSNALNTSASRVINIIAATNNTGGGASSLSSNISFSNANGMTFYTSAGGAIAASYTVPNVAAFLTTARASNDGVGLATAQTNVTWTVNSAGLSLNAAGYAGTGTSVTGNAALTVNSNGVQFNGASLAGTTTAVTGGALLTLNSAGLRLDGSGLAGTSTGFAGANISGSMTHNSAGLALSLSVAAPGGGGGGVALSAGTQSVSTGTMVFANSNGITFGMSGSNQITASYNSTQFAGTGTSATNATITLNSNGLAISVAAPGAAAENNWMNLLGANTAGNTTASGSTIGLSGLNLTLSGTNASQIVISAPATSSLSATGQLSISVNGSTISIGVPAPVTLSYFNPQDAYIQVAGQQGQGSLHIQPAQFPDVQFDRIALPIVFTGTSNLSGSFTVSFNVGIYTRTASTLSLASSTSASYGVTMSGTVGSYSQLAGFRLLTIGSTNTISEGQYWVGIQSRTTTGGAAGMTMSQYLCSQVNSVFSGIFGQASATSAQLTRGLGVYSATTTAMPSSIAFSQINGTASVALRKPSFYVVSGTV